MRRLQLPSGAAVPVLGQGTWGMGESARWRTEEVASLRLGLDLGMTLIDTAEMYADGGAETVVGEAIAGCRDEVFLVSKVLPGNAGRAAAIRACEASLKRLKTDRLELYLLHWRGGTPLEETLAGFDQLARDGKILSWGVSNFDKDDLDDLADLAGGAACVVNQVLYNLTRRGIEFDLIPAWAGRVPVMAYSPLEQGRLLKDATLARIAAAHGATPAQVALAWVIRRDDVCAIPKASRADHVRENVAATELQLTPAELSLLDRAFAPPKRKKPLEIL